MASKVNAQSEIKDIEKKYNVTVDSFFLKANPYKQYEREEVPEDLSDIIQLSLMEKQK